MNSGTFDLAILAFEGLGFLGIHLVDLFYREGCAVRTLDRTSTHTDGPAPIPVGVRFTRGDFSDSEAVVLVKFDLVYLDLLRRLSGTTVPNNLDWDPVYDVDDNLATVLNQDSVDYRNLLITSCCLAGDGDSQLHHPCHPVAVDSEPRLR